MKVASLELVSRFARPVGLLVRIHWGVDVGREGVDIVVVCAGVLGTMVVLLVI